jgi:hypothetical protein
LVLVLHLLIDFPVFHTLIGYVIQSLLIDVRAMGTTKFMLQLRVFTLGIGIQIHILVSMKQIYIIAQYTIVQRKLIATHKTLVTIEYYIGVPIERHVPYAKYVRFELNVGSFKIGY